MAVTTLLAQRQQQVCAVKELVKQRNGIIRDGGGHGVGQQVQTAKHIGNWLIVEKDHGHHYPDNHAPQ